MNSLGREPLSPFAPGETDTSLRTSNELVQHLVIELGGISYYVRSHVECILPTESLEPNRTPRPATVIHLPNSEISLEAIQIIFRRYLAEDDVFQNAFIEGSCLVIQTPSLDTPTLSLSKDVEEFLNKQSISFVCLKDSDTVPPGPYIAIDGELHQPWRLYPDDLGAFTTSVIPDGRFDHDGSSTTRCRQFQSAPFTGASTAVPVPSRLYFQKSATKPLAGMRISVKDNMHLAGVKTTLGSRAYTELYGKQTTTSEFVEQLIRKGAVVVGKTKMSAFLGSETPPNQCIDYFPPWNPRGDGYQGPSGDSSGAAASIAGYSWLDVSLCTDTMGGMRHPASSHGTWGHRTSWNSLSLTGTVHLSPAFDTLCILARSSPLIGDVLSAARSWESVQKPTEIIYPTDWLCLDNNKQCMMHVFLAALERYLGLKCVELSLSDLWSKTAPAHVRDTELDTFTRGIVANVQGFDGYHSFDEFRAKYPQIFGKEPYLSPEQKKKWERGCSISEQEYYEAIENVGIFKNWFDEYVWRINDKGVKRIMILPQGRPGANYRDRKIQTTSGPLRATIRVVSVLGAPQIVIPIGQNPYQSEVSGRTEYAPIMTTLVGPHGCDLTLLSVAEETLREASWQSTILTGRHMLHLGDNVRNSRPVDDSN